jgi:hypothetical protein
MSLILEQWIKPHIDYSSWEFFDLSCKNRDLTDDKVLKDAVAAGKSFTVMLKMGSGGFTVTWASGGVHYWPNNITPTITGTASKTDIFTFVSDGTYWFGTTAGQAYNV